MADKKQSPFVALYKVVKEMRNQQKEYFRTKSQSALIASKEFEKAVDRLVLEIEDEAKSKGIEI